MRLPKIRQLTDEQKKVYLYAPTDRHILVHGPPGTGKTLIACLRAIELQKKNVPVVLGMFNRVLAKYSSNAAEDGRMPSQTVVAWFRTWWNESRMPPHPCAGGKLILEVPFEEKDQAKTAGARWDPNEWRPWGGKGAWVVSPEMYFARPEAFAAWRLWHNPPVMDSSQEAIDWTEVAKHILDNEDIIPDKSLELGTLLIDEGQDFPPGFYKTLRQITAIALARGKNVSNRPRCFILADENQQITEHHSTLLEIAETLKIADDNKYLLLDNFRNSKEVAELARAFFADVGVLPKLPKRSSERPMLSIVDRPTDLADRIRVWITNNPGKEVGVLVFDEAARESMTDMLRDSLGRMRGRNIKIQSYSWKTRRVNKVDDLVFDTPDVVTVLNMQSCKGLEFDAVFIVDLHKARIGMFGPDRFKMQMFVAVSRAREWVHLIDSGPQAGSGPCFGLLPGPDVLEREGAGGRTHATGSRKDSPSLRSTTSTGVRNHQAVNAHTNSDVEWIAALQKLARKKSLQLDDRRSAGGALWVSGGMDLAPLLEPLGLSFSEKRSGWWRK